MLVKFDSDSGQFFMDGEFAVPLLKMMGHSGTIPGAIKGAEVPAALARLEQELKGATDGSAVDSDEDEEPKVSLHNRAFPLVELLQRAAKQQSDVLWDHM